MTQRQSQVNVLSIGEFAKLCRTTPRTIRFYDQKGLIKPVFVDQWTKYRYYSPLQMREFFKIKLLNSYKVSLKEVGNNLGSKNKSKFLDSRLTLLKKRIEEEQKEFDFLQTMRKVMYESKDLNRSLKREVLGPYLLLCNYVARGQYDQINSEIIKLIDYAKTNKIEATEKQMVFYLDPVAYKPKNTRLEICLILKGLVEPKIKLSEGFYLKYFPRSSLRVFDYQGPFEYITLIYQKLLEKKQDRILKPNEVGFDIHYKGSWNEKSEYSYFTKICFRD